MNRQNAAMGETALETLSALFGEALARWGADWSKVSIDVENALSKMDPRKKDLIYKELSMMIMSAHPLEMQ